MSLVQICHCGHDKDTHFERRHTCLGVHCECLAFVHRDDPDRPERTAKRNPRPDGWDGVPDCAYPDPQDSIVTPLVHPSWCMCGQCIVGGSP